MSQYPAVIDLADIDGTNGFRIDGEKAGATLGDSVASAGDVNGDGFDDLILGGSGNGAGYVIFGSAEGFEPVVDVTSLDGANGFKINDFHIGNTVSSAGDFNGDGFGDILLGSYRQGAAYLIYGKADGFAPTINLSQLDGTDGTTFDRSGYQSGWQVASAGDINGDGFDDLILGCRGRYDGFGNYTGGTYVIFGTAAGLGANVSLYDLPAAQGFKIVDAGRYDDNGRSVSYTGDVNGDGFDDLLVGAPGGYSSVSSYVIFGKASGFGGTFDLGSINGHNGFGITAGGGIGTVASAGDVNGDGRADLIEYGYDGGGKTYVVLGEKHLGTFVNTATLDGTNGFAIEGASGRITVSSAGDVNGDGFDDLLIADRYADNSANNSGSTYVVFGKASGFAAVIDLSTLDGTDGFRIDGAAAGDESGVSVASAGDLNGDGLADIIIGAPGSSANGSNSGAVYVVYGVLPDTAVDRVGTSASQSLVGGNFNDKLSGLAGDDQLWGNGGNDKLLGSSGADVLRGGDGNDNLVGGTGNDTLIGGAGHDRMSGGDGADHFIFDATSDSGLKRSDVITDLSKEDVIDLSAIDADTTIAGDQAFKVVHAFSGHAGQLVLIWNQATNVTLLEGDVDGDGKADFVIDLTGKHDHFSGLVL